MTNKHMKGVQHHQSLGKKKGKLKPQDTTTFSTRMTKTQTK